MSDNTVAQLHRTLVDALRKNRPAALHRPVTVAEIYQDLVPYRTARAEVGFEMNADYEHTLLRLLAGEGDYARIEPREVRDKLRMELDSPNPDVSLYRDFAACDVWVNVPGVVEPAAAEEDVAATASWEDELVGPEPVPADAAPIQAALGMLDDLDDEALADAIDEAEQDMPDTSHGSRPFEIAQDGIRHTRTGPHDCPFCGGDLPGDRMINFCPHCGSDQSQQPCPSCGEMLEPLWRFCVACGARVRQLGDHVN